jgi:murein DD-endopeptidase MepM/ murein hydrolase activator NlpD
MTAPAPLLADWAGWQWPLRAWKGRAPVISHEFEAGERYKRDPATGRLVLNYAVHLGLDLMYPWHIGDPIDPASSALRHDHASGFYAGPEHSIPVFAAGPGMVWDAGLSALGLHVQIDHGKVSDHAGGVNTYYQHLCTLERPWKRGDVIKAGDLLGVMGGDPANSPHLRHLHFELWFPRAGTMAADWPVDPAPYMALW